MSEPSVAPQPAQSPERRRQLLHVAAGLALVVAVGALALFVFHKKAPPPQPAELAPVVHDEHLLAAVARLDGVDPRWRFAALEEDRAQVPDDKNAAPLVLKAALIPQPWRGPDLDPLRERLRAGTLDENPRAKLSTLGATLDVARKLAGFSRGRHAVAWNIDDPLLTELPHLAATDMVVGWLALDAAARAGEGHVDEALVSVRAALVAAHAIGDEPMLVSQMRRLQWQYDCAQALQESLRRGQGTDGPLFAVQTALADEAAAPMLLTAARAERAGLHGLMTALAKGELTRADPDLLGVLRAAAVSRILGSVRLRKRESLEATHAWLLEHTTKLVEIADMPPEAQLSPLTKLAATAEQAPPGGAVMAKGLPLVEIWRTCQQAQAMLRCAVVAVAMERYRLANGRWPDKVDEVVPKYLTKVPADPYDGKPLRYARHKDVVVVYAIGPDGKDDGGKPDELNHFDKKEGFDVGFRLWNVEARHKAAK
jgi:hypothetical protein